MSPRTPFDDLPRVDLPDVRHHQVRHLLVTEATGSRAAATARRRFVPLAVGAVAAATVTAAALGLPVLLDGTTGPGPAGPAASPGPDGTGDCEEIAASASPEQADDLRFLSADPGALTLTVARAALTTDTCGPTRVASQAFAQVAADGTVTAALTLWSGEPAPDGGDAVGSAAESSVVDRPGTERSGSVVPEPVPSAALTEVPLLGGTAKVLEADVLQVWWSQDGTDVSLTASGLPLADVLALAGQVGVADGAPSLAPGAVDGLDELVGWEASPPEASAPSWFAEYDGGGTAAPDSDAGLVRASVSAQRSGEPWQARLSTYPAGAARIAVVAGEPAVVLDNGAPSVRFLTWQPLPGVQVDVMGQDVDVLAFAETLRPVAADDPRIPLEPVGQPTD